MGFIQPFMNPAASHLASGRVLYGVVQNEKFSLAGGWSKSAVSKRKDRLIFRPGDVF